MALVFVWWAALLFLLAALGRASAAAALGPSSHAIKATGGFWGRGSSRSIGRGFLAMPSLWGVRGGADGKKEEDEGEESNPAAPAAAAAG